MQSTKATLPVAALSLLSALLMVAPAFNQAHAATKEQKMETCKFGADNDKLEGKERAAFIKKCMGNANYEPAARKAAMKQTATKKKPAAKKPASPTAAPPAAMMTPSGEAPAGGEK
ncbi:MAG: hypothetical protein GC182_10090 [Rhodopseudomonas sp.]|nr:hypothetical protein [Rhodopseudomonas sp.]